MIAILIIFIFLPFVGWDLGIRYQTYIDPGKEAIFSINDMKYMKFTFEIQYGNIKKVELLDDSVNRSIIYRIYLNIKGALIFPSWHYMNPVLLELYYPIKPIIEYKKGLQSISWGRLPEDQKEGTINKNPTMSPLVRPPRVVVISDMENSIKKEYEKYQRREHRKMNAGF
jgi:hypothetical protein